MADQFISALTGDQMDEALLDMARHTSEAWSQGTRAGSPVGTGDETYHNNSKYWASIAQGAIPEGTAGALFYDRPQTLSEEQKKQGRQNLGVVPSNRNLLDNGWFTINQRNATSWASGYGVDRWKAIFANVTVTSNGLSLASNSAIIQFIENPERLNGITVTLSILYADGTIEHTSPVVFKTDDFKSYTTPSNLLVRIGVYGNWGLTSAGVLIYNASSSAVTIKAVKLELGSVSTLANDTAPNYAEELAKCQRYYRRISGNDGYILACVTAVTENLVDLFLPFDMHKAQNPIATHSGIRIGSGITGGIIPFLSNGSTILRFPVTTATVGYTYPIVCEGNAYFDISCDL